MEAITETPKTKEKHNDSWGEVISYQDGRAWGVAPDGRTVCLGRESQVREAIANPNLHCQNETINGIIELERKLKYEGDLQSGRNQGINAKRSTSKPIRPNYQRVRFGRPARVKHFNVRQPKASKKTAVYRPEPK